MENSDFETILTVKEFDKCCSFYHGLLRDATVSINSSFMMKLKLSESKNLTIYAVNPIEKDFIPRSTLLNFDLKKKGVEHAIEYLLQHNLKFITDNDLIRTMDPAGNILQIKAGDKCDFKAIRADSRTQKVQIS